LDLSTIIGIILAFALMVGAIMTGGPLSIFINTPSILIVVGGTIGCILTSYPFKELFGAFAILKKAFLNKKISYIDTINKLIDLSTKARKEGILSLQSIMNEIKDDFLLKGIQMAVDGQEPESLKSMLYQEIDKLEERHENGADIFTTMATYAPAMGMIGTLIGLVQMLQTMEDPGAIGPAMAVALLTTFYGAVIANVFASPVAGKLKLRSQTEVLMKTLITEGMDSIMAGENPRLMEQKLHAFIPPDQRKSIYEK
jgi:chemotaxis protein MotA